MAQRKLAGPNAGVHKYDLLTALSLIGLTGSKTEQTSMIRLMALITARYNWQSDELCVGQRDMARMWAINERSVKREMKRLTDADILICTRSGVRGRVGAYRLNAARIACLSEPGWASIGPDYEERMRDRYRRSDVKVVQLQNYRTAEPVAQTESGPWGRAMTHLAAQDQALFDAWFARLTFLGCEKGLLRLRASGAFVQRYIETHLMRDFLRGVEPEFGAIHQVVFET